MRAAFRFLSLTGSTSLSYSSLLTTPSLSKFTNFTAREDDAEVPDVAADVHSNPIRLIYQAHMSEVLIIVIRLIY